MIFEKIQQKHRKQVMAIFNHYIKNGTAAFPPDELPEAFFDKMLEITSEYPAYCLIENEDMIGFGFISAYKPWPTFKQTAEITYFIAPEYIGQGLGSRLLAKLEVAAKGKGISNIIAEISTENVASQKFHEKNGFVPCGTLKEVGSKMGRNFGVVYMQKKI